MIAKYTDEKNIQMLIYLLKENNIKKIIANPGTMNISFVISVQSDPFFEVYSCVDERSACYMACGLAKESNEPVVITCTGATASRNYMSAITEAFYRKIPILAVTCTPSLANIGQNIPQMIDRTKELSDTYKLSVFIPTIRDAFDEWNDTIKLNEAINELKHNGGGPVHINLETRVTRNFDCKSLPIFRKISRITPYNEFPTMKMKKIGIFVGNHNIWTNKLTKLVENFCEQYNAIVICDHTSNYFGKYKVLLNIICDQEYYKTTLTNFDLIIHLGDVSGAYMNFNTNEVWRVNPDGKIVDTFKKLTNVFEMEEEYFFDKYTKNLNKTIDITLYNSFEKEYNNFIKLFNCCELPFSNPWIANKVFSKIPENSVLHLAILNTLRSWNYIENVNSIKCYCNTGGFGIDGIMSSFIGSSLYNKIKNYYCVIGDLAFFYDLNVLGNRHISNNLRILLINNGCGTEFHNYWHPATVLNDAQIGKYIAADGHNGNKSKTVVKDFVQNLGFEYICADCKEEFVSKIDYFTSEKIYEKPIVFEVFTNSKDESDALYLIKHLKTNKKIEMKTKIQKNVTPAIKNKMKKVIEKMK